MKKKYWILLILLLTVLSGGGYMVFKQHTEKEKMIAIAHSAEAMQIYEKHMKANDSRAFSEQGIIHNYKINDSEINYNPMGGMEVTVYVNNDTNKYFQFTILDNGNGKLESGSYIISADLDNDLETNKK